eukprot:scaffold398_cov305-Prasinococcus_capsulatus_cf.AAC.8
MPCSRAHSRAGRCHPQTPDTQPEPVTGTASRAGDVGLQSDSPEADISLSMSPELHMNCTRLLSWHTHICRRVRCEWRATGVDCVRGVTQRVPVQQQARASTHQMHLPMAAGFTQDVQRSRDANAGRTYDELVPFQSTRVRRRIGASDECGPRGHAAHGRLKSLGPAAHCRDL